MDGSAEHDKADVYPETVWTTLREQMIPRVMFACVLGILAGVFLGRQALVMAFTVAAGAGMAAIIPVLVLEFRADMRWEREHPQAEED